MTDLLPGPTGLDYHEAYKAMYPGLVQAGVKLQDISDQALKVVDRAARLRRAERQRVKDAFLRLAVTWETENVAGTPLDLAADEIRKTAEEIR